MSFLIDTHLLIWATDTSAALAEKLPDEAARLMGDPDIELVFSAVSIWEVAVKAARRRSDFAIDPLEFLRVLRRAQYSELSIESEHAAAVSGLPLLHRDPFDRLLIAQAKVEGLTLLTSDAMIARYDGPIRKV